MKESALISQIKLIRGRWTPGPTIGVQSQSRWQGSSEIRIDSEKWRVWQCDSVLEMRQHLSEDSTVPLVLITPLSTTAIGDDVRARLFKQQLIAVDPWNGLAERFKARQVDPVLRQSMALADVASEALGDGEPPVAPSGVLTPELIWQVVLQNRLGLSTAKPDLLEFLPWVASDGAVAKLKALGDALQTPLVSWLSLSVGDLAPILFRTLADGYGQDAIAVGLALGALTGSGADPRALGRLERFTGNHPLPNVLARQWNEAAEKWAAREQQIDRVRRELTRADQILESLGATDAAIESPWSPLGFQRRLDIFAEQLVGGPPPKLQQAYTSVVSHEGSRYLEELRGRRERAEMAMRLVRWLEQSHALPSNLFDSVRSFEIDGSWVDWARHQVLGGDELEGISRSYRKLFDRVTSRREEENRRFSELLTSNAASGKVSGLLMIEDVLSTIVAPLAKASQAGVLFIVMDGMSLPVWRELAGDLRIHGWQEWTPVDKPAYRCAITVIPSATNYSRSSLLCGELVTGAQNLEKKGFQELAEFRSYKPVLFHKDEVGSSGADLSEALRLAVGKNERRIVGVVLNVIDDSLGGPEQRSFRWTLLDIPILRALLSEAKNAGRIVILASDHGHVLDHGSKLNRKTESSDRWRPVDDEAFPSTDELLVTGSRVLVDGNRLIALTSECLRYTANRRLGYHGGLTSQECVAPLAVLAPALMEIDGWEILQEAPPDWWSEGDVMTQFKRPKTTKAGKRSDSQPHTMPLFESSDGRCDWVTSFLESRVFAEQMSTFAGRLKQDQVEKSLRVLADRNFVLLKSVFAQRLELSGLRIDGWIASLQRILNVEGYPVLSVDSSQTVRLNLQLLREQFDIGESDGR
ncbi:MAG TPA: BREX-2 system phosphatase PglZ [Terriglobales bacterium]|nr:BREX-2 system phosphatase PglZ [Terriglobales bacterium]